jgi:hypothetical protein
MLLFGESNQFEWLQIENTLIQLLDTSAIASTTSAMHIGSGNRTPSMQAVDAVVCGLVRGLNLVRSFSA